MATKPTFPSDAADKFIVRLPPGMREKINESAKSNGRSMNAEIVERLLSSFMNQDRDLHMVRAAARLEVARETVKVVMVEAGKQLVQLSSASKQAEMTAESAMDAFDSLADITQEFIDGDVKDPAGAKVRFKALQESRQALGNQLPTIEPLNILSLVEAVQANEKERNDAIVAKVLREAPTILKGGGDWS